MPTSARQDPQRHLDDLLARHDAQNAVLTDSADEDAIRDVLRVLSDADLRHIAEHGHRGPADTQPTSTTAQQLARRQVRLRAAGHRMVVRALHRMGHRFAGTGGWWILPFAVPTLGLPAHLGFVNIAHGVAVGTGVALSDELVEALTVPAQPAGPQASGALAWSAGDPGEARRAKAPDGWLQLSVDVRVLPGDTDSPDDYTDEAGQAVDPHAQASVDDWFRISHWCLPTCYGEPDQPGEPGHPGYDRLDTPSAGWRAAHLPITAWPRRGPLGPPLRDLRRTAAGGLCWIAATLAERLGIHDQVVATIGAGEHPPTTAPDEAAVGEAAMLVSRLAADHRPPDTPVWRTNMTRPARDWLDTKLAENDIGELAVLAAAGDEHLRWAWTGLLADMVGLIVARDAAPVALAVADAIRATDDTDEARRALTPTGQVVEELTQPTITHLTDTLLRPLGVFAAQTQKAALDAYAAHGPFEVDLPVPLPVAFPARAPGPLPDSADTPVGVTEIAAAAAVQPNTVEAWRRRHDQDAPHPFPELTWTVGGRPAWRWGDIRTWLESTGRLPGAAH